MAGWRYEIGWGAGILLACLGIGSCNYMQSLGKNTQILQEADLNNNGRNDKFYTIDGKVVVTEVDGEPIIDFIKRNSK